MIPGAVLAAASFSRRRATVAVFTATAAILTAPIVGLVRSGPTAVNIASAGARIVLVTGICALVGTLIDLLRQTRDAQEQVSRALDLHLYTGEFVHDRYREVYTGPGVERILGRPLRPGERPEDAWDAAVHPDDRPAFAEFFSADGLSSREFSELEYRVVGNDGSVRWVLDRVHATHGEDGTVQINGLCLDVTERRRIAEELRDARERLTRLVEAVDDVFFELERTGSGDLHARHVNPGISRLLGGPPGADVLASWRGAVHEDDQPALREHIAHMRAGEPTETEYRMVGKDGVVRNVWSRVFPHRDLAGRLLLVGVLSDITERTRMAEALEVALAQAERQAQTDALTGLANRARLSATLDARLERVDTAICTGLLLLDVDRFKRINDTHGHQTGDEVLIELGRRLTAIVGERGLVARLGGEELCRAGDRRAPRAGTARAGRGGASGRGGHADDRRGPAHPGHRLDRRGAGRRELPHARLPALGRRSRAVCGEAARPEPGLPRRGPDAARSRARGARGRPDRAEPRPARERARGHPREALRGRGRARRTRSRPSSGSPTTRSSAATSAAGCTTSARRASRIASSRSRGRSTTRSGS